jgi:hypothetical protein
MWMLSFLPDSFLYMVIVAIMVIGVLTYVLSMFTGLSPLIKPYKEPLRIGGTVLFILGIYFFGSYNTEMEWRKKVEEVQAKVAEAEKASDAANDKLAKVSKQKQKVRVEYYTRVHERIKEVEKQIDVECKLDPVVPKLHNDAAMNPEKKAVVTPGPMKTVETTK